MAQRQGTTESERDAMTECPACRSALPDAATACPACGLATAAPAGAATPKKGGMARWLSLTLVALLVACLAFCIVMALPDYLADLARMRRRRAVQEIKSSAAVVQAFLAAKDHVPRPAGPDPGPGWHEAPLSSLGPLLAPQFAATLPEKDPWGQPYVYGFDARQERFYILSTGANRRREGALPDQPVETHCEESDIVWRDTGFLKSPGSIVHRCGEDVAAQEVFR